ncbi:MAG: hypothetical protein IJH18_03400 [Bacilli bacterium]|nr:hypothetical protein [Bacilli bacterium]
MICSLVVLSSSFEIVTIFQENRKIKFMLYNIEYFVIEIGGTVEIYPINDETRKKHLKT